MTIDQTLQEFYALPVEKKKKKLEVMLEQLKNSDEIFMKFLQKIQKKDVSEATLNVLYSDIMKFSEAIKEYAKTKSTASLEKAKTYLDKMRLLEQEDRKKDMQDVENMEQMFQTM